MNKRIQELDSLRGIAAFIVFMSHSLGMLPQNPVIGGINIYHTPLHMFWDGHASVIFFFLLSGFVCKKYFESDIKIKYFNFVVKKFFRIYPAYWISIITGYIFCNTFALSKPIEGLSSWYNSLWVNKVSFYVLIKHCILFLGHFDTGAINSVIWTLVVEMRITFILPFIIVLMAKFKKSIRGIFPAVLLSVIAFYISKIKLFDSVLSYSYIFVMGLLIALNYDNIMKFYVRLNRFLRYVILILGVAFYGFAFNFYRIASRINDGTYLDFIISFGASLIVIFILGEVKLGRKFTFLKNKIVMFMGKISYSFFLWHLVVILSLKKTYPIFKSHMLYWCMSLIIALIVSYISQRYIERPFIEISKNLINKKNKKGVIA